MASRKPTISSTVSPLTRRATRNPASCDGVASPCMMRRIAHVDSDTLRSSPPSRLVRHPAQEYRSALLRSYRRAYAGPGTGSTEDVRQNGGIILGTHNLLDRSNDTRN